MRGESRADEQGVGSVAADGSKDIKMRRSAIRRSTITDTSSCPLAVLMRTGYRCLTLFCFGNKTKILHDF